MRILEIAFEPPSMKSGGGIVVKQSIISLASNGTVDYIGPDFEDDTFDDGVVANKYLLVYHPTIRSRIVGALFGISSGYYLKWKEIIKRVDWEQYDVIHIEFTKYPMVVKTAKKKARKAKIAVRVHNIEKEFFRNQFLSNKNLENLIQYLLYRNKERYSIKTADVLIYLTNDDEKHANELYKSSGKNTAVIPVCISDAGVAMDRNLSDRALLISGSLWYGPNYEGVVWFLDNVWIPMCKQKMIPRDVHLILAGAKPNKKIQQYAEKYGNVKVVDSPKEMKPFFNCAYACVVPVFTGAGMKVKIADAMMYGLPIISSTHALIGYKYKEECIIKADSVEEFKNGISKILAVQGEEYNRIRCKQRKMFLDHYEMGSSCRMYEQILKVLTE